jgi:hypothetical protein
VLLVVNPVAFILGSVSVSVFSKPMGFVVSPEAIVDVSISMD